MKTENGFTLIELMIVISIVGIVAASALVFPPLMEKKTVESYTKEIQSLLIKARNDAANMNSPATVTFPANQVQVSQDKDGNGVAEVSLKNFPKYTIAGNQIVFDRRGLTNDLQTIQITGYSSGSAPAVDCIRVFSTRINIGKWNGVNCVQQ